MKDQQINSFGKGMMKDLSSTTPQEGSYVDAQNIRIISDGSGSENSSGIVIDVKGNKKVLDITTLNIAGVGYPEIYTSWVNTGSLTIPDLTLGLGIGVNQVLTWESNTYLYVGGIMWFNASSGDVDLSQTLNEGGGFEVTSYSLEVLSQSNLSVVNYGEINVSIYTFLDVLDDISSVEIIGHTTIRNTLVLFAIINLTAYPTAPQSAVLSCNLDDTVLGVSLVYMRDLGFDANYPIEAVGRYESNTVQRVYWTDNLNPLRTLNIVDSLVVNLPKEELDFRPAVNFSQPEVLKVSFSGKLPAGKYQYAYRLLTEGGVLTRFSPLSNLVNIAGGYSYWEYEADPENKAEYGDTLPGEETDKSVVIKLSNLDLDYEYIEVAVIYRTSKNSVDSVYLLDKVRLTSIEKTISHINSIGTPITIEEVTSFSNIPNKAVSINTKDNRLFVGGLEYSEFNLDFNAKAYRYKRDDGVKYPIKSLEESGNDEGSGYSTYVSDPTATSTLDDVNPYNNYGEEEAPNTDWYKFKKDGVTLGGEGPNVSYKFIKKSLQGHRDWDIPSTAPFVTGEFRSDDTCTEEGSNVGDYKSPVNASEFVGYQRDEIYRFGVVLYDTSGNPGFVNWIGDVRFPDYQDYDHEASINGGIYNFTLAQYAETESGTNYNFNASTGGAYENSEDFDPANEGGYEHIKSSYDQEDCEGYEFAYSNLYALGIQFRVSIPEDLKSKISGYKIVRVERTQENKTVLGSGILNYLSQFKDGLDPSSTWQAFGGGYELGCDGGFGVVQPATLGYAVENIPGGFGQTLPFLFTIDSPEWPFTGDYPSGASGCSYVKISGALGGRQKYSFTQNSVGDDTGAATIFSHHRLAPKEEDLFATFPLAYSGKLERSATKNITIEGVTGQINGTESSSALSFTADVYKGIINRAQIITNSAVENIGIGEESLLCAVNSGLGGDGELDLDVYTSGVVDYFNHGINFTKYAHVPKATANKNKLLATVKTDLQNQYGGDTELARKNNTYIPAGPFINILGDDSLNADSAHDVWGGDTYVVMYDLEKIRRHDNDIDSGAGAGVTRDSVNFAFPVETTINTSLRGGWHFANKKDWDSASETLLNTFELDSCYSSENNTEVFIPKPLNFKDFLGNDTRILYSELKSNNSTIDSWRIFKTENYKDLDTSSGKLVKLINFKNDMLFLQDRGFGAVSVNPVTTTVAEDGSTIVLGTGDVIQGFRYISTTVGVQTPRSVVNTTKGIYWVDKLTKKAYAFRANGLDSISDTHGMKAWFTGNVSKESKITLGNDVINDEVLFSVDGTTLAFSEVLNKFTSFYPYGTDMYINTYDRLFSINPSSSSDIYEHNIGASSTFFGVKTNSYVEFLVNKHPIHTKVFDTIEWYTASTSNKFDSGVFTNSVDTLVIDSLSGAANKERMTRMPVPRTNTYSRFRDAYMKVKLTTSQEFTLHYVKTSFRISRR